MPRILVTGALGQIGAELTAGLRRRYGRDEVVASDVRIKQPQELERWRPFDFVDVTDPHQLHEVVRRREVDTIYHLAALLSAVAEEKPHIAWRVNTGGLYEVLEVARTHGCQVFVPSSIGAFGPTTPREDTPQDTIQRPTTMYGVSKVTGELLGDYYWARFGVDVRGVRYPGLISHEAPPGGGTTDYAVDMFYGALRHGRYTSFLRQDARLPMMYMPDALDAAIQLMEADASWLAHRNAFNVTAMSFTPEELGAEIRKHIPGFELDYEVDPVRQGIADSWPMRLDDTAAREEWGWSPEYDLSSMTADMLDKLRQQLHGRI